MKRTLSVKAEVELPMLPNFLRMTDGQSLPIEAVTDDTLRELGAAWTESLVEHAQRRRVACQAK